MVSRFSRAIVVTVAALAALLLADHFYFADLRAKHDNGAVNEAFLRKGSLGNLLHEGNFLAVSDRTAAFATHDMCASDDELSRFAPHNSFRIRLKLHSIIETPLDISLQVMGDNADPDVRTFTKRLFIHPGKHFYSLHFEADIDELVQLSFNIAPDSELLLSDIIVDGRFGRKLAIVENGVSTLGSFDRHLEPTKLPGNTTSHGVLLSASTNPLTFSIHQKEMAALYRGVFPGKRNEGYCRYKANLHPVGSVSETADILPTVGLIVDPDDLHGPAGILTNKEQKGRGWEVPADILLDNGRERKRQRVGLRFHGGGIGRTKYTQSFRVYARKRYGKSTLTPQLVFGKKRDIPLETIVLKYTYQAYFEERQDFNPFNHAFALDIADHIGALVPSHGLVDLFLNGEPQGLYLAMEHLSDKTFNSWLDHDSFTAYYYRKDNPIAAEQFYTLLLAQVLMAKGEDTFDALQRIYDVDNVLNSIILSLYIADDDFCQGVEVMHHDETSSGPIVTSINWDLDHAFLTFENGAFSVDPERSVMSILRRPTGINICQKQQLYSWLYEQSPRFRKRLHERLQELSTGALSPDYLSRLLAPYRRINERYFAGSFAPAISDLERFTSKRANILMEQLHAFEKDIVAHHSQVSPVTGPAEQPTTIKSE